MKIEIVGINKHSGESEILAIVDTKIDDGGMSAKRARIMAREELLLLNNKAKMEKAVYGDEKNPYQEFILRMDGVILYRDDRWVNFLE